MKKKGWMSSIGHVVTGVVKTASHNMAPPKGSKKMPSAFSSNVGGMMGNWGSGISAPSGISLNGMSAPSVGKAQHGGYNLPNLNAGVSFGQEVKRAKHSARPRYPKGTRITQRIVITKTKKL